MGQACLRVIIRLCLDWLSCGNGLYAGVASQVRVLARCVAKVVAGLADGRRDIVANGLRRGRQCSGLYRFGWLTVRSCWSVLNT